MAGENGNSAGRSSLANHIACLREIITYSPLYSHAIAPHLLQVRRVSLEKEMIAWKSLGFGRPH
jgi:hypothetical protein